MRNPFTQILTTETRLSRDAGGFHILIIDGKEKLYFITAETYGNTDSTYFSFRGDNTMRWVTTLQEVFTKTQSKEEIAAEESVAKAREALVAAENALKVVKESK